MSQNPHTPHDSHQQPEALHQGQQATGQPPAYGQQSQNTGHQGAPTAGPVPEPGTPTKPEIITRALGMIYASLVLSLIGVVVQALMMRDSPQMKQLRDQGASESMVTVSIVAVVVVGLLLLALEFLFTWFAGKGRNWARIVLAVLAALTLFTVVTSLLSGQVLGVVGDLMFIIGTILLFLPQANAWFSAVKASRRGY